MVLTRRAFLLALLTAAAAAALGRVRPGAAAPGPCRGRGATPPLRYPGPLRPLRNIGRPGIWRG